MTHRRARPRAAALLATGAYALHQLRYALGYGHDAHHELGTQGHAYMTVLAPMLAMGIVAVMAELGVRLIAARSGATTPAAPPGVRRVWALATACLLVSYATQELVEGALAPGHPAGAAALTAGGGWVALPLAAAIGLALALLDRGTRAALLLAGEPAPRLARPRAAALIRAFTRPTFLSIRTSDGPPPARGPPLAAAS